MDRLGLVADREANVIGIEGRHIVVCLAAVALRNLRVRTLLLRLLGHEDGGVLEMIRNDPCGLCRMLFPCLCLGVEFRLDNPGVATSMYDARFELQAAA